jgi:hypothetical protein
MENFKPIDNESFKPEYWEGPSNIFVRYWVYLSRGLDFINQAKYLIVGILALYAILKLTDPLWMIAMFVVSIPVLTILGHWQLYKVSKTQEFVTTTKGSVLGYTSYNINVKTLETLQEIKELLRSANR